MSEESLSRVVVLSNSRGLHARAAAKFVRIVESFHADVTVAKDETIVSAHSIMGLMMLAASFGTELKLVATGQEAKAVMGALVDLVERKFDEDERRQ
jgi:phosphocarrier protein